ncbi:MAG: DNA polymerase III subunit epsilon [Pelagibacteraceae bacterium]
MKEIFLDTETTGLSYINGHKIVEIACIESEDLVPTKNVFHKLINPLRDVPDEAFQIHGFSSEFLKDKETFDQVVDEFIEFIKDKKIIIHNASFDLGFINHELKLLKKDEIKKENIVDSLKLARAKYPGSSNSLDSLCRKFNIDLSRRTKHNALLDCELLREVYINLIDVKEPRLIFSSENKNNNVNDVNKTEVDYYKKIIKLTPEELENHKNFIKKEFKKNFY